MTEERLLGPQRRAADRPILARLTHPTGGWCVTIGLNQDHPLVGSFIFFSLSSQREN
jgi:hypothetical protein